MVNYRRNNIPGGYYFFTVVLHNRKLDLLVRHFDLLQNAMLSVKKILPYKTHAFVVLPEHLHVIWQLPDGDSHYSLRWKKIKTHFTRSLVKKGLVFPKNNRGEVKIWQRRFWEHSILNDEDMQKHIDYIHFNPVKHGLVGKTVDWRYSSFHAYVKRGILPVDWGYEFRGELDDGFGE